MPDERGRPAALFVLPPRTAKGLLAKNWKVQAPSGPVSLIVNPALRWYPESLG